MNKLLTLLLTGLLALNTIQITQDTPSAATKHVQVTDATITASIMSAADDLRSIGIEIPDELIAQMTEDMIDYHAGLHRADDHRAESWDIHLNHSALAGNILLELGMGEAVYAENGWTQIGWMPTSHQIYAFDAEVYDVDRMYTWLLQGVESIVPGLRIENITEEISNDTELDFDYKSLYDEDGNLKELTEELLALLFQSMPEEEGNRSVSFIINGHPHTVILHNNYDWIDPDVLDKLNGILQAEGFEHQLYSYSLGQMVVVIYGPQETADAFTKILFPN